MRRGIILSRGWSGVVRASKGGTSVRGGILATGREVLDYGRVGVNIRRGGFGVGQSGWKI